MKNRVLYMAVGIALMLVLAGCKQKNILPPKQMEDILVDLHTADGVLQEAGYSYGQDEAQRAYYYVILAKHGTTQAQFDSSLLWYTANPAAFEQIYPRVIERLEAQRNSLQAQ